MKIKYFLQLITLFLSITICSPAVADIISEKEALNWAQSKGNEILQILTSEDTEHKYNKLDNILSQDVDLDHAAKFVVGRYWKQMTPTQQQEYTDLFKRYTSSLYKSYPVGLEQGDVTFNIDKVITKEEKASVFCTIYIKQLEQTTDKRSQGGIKTTFILHKQNNLIKVRDLKIEESSFLVSYRERFYKMIHEENDDEIEWFLEDLENQIEDSENQNKKNFDAEEF